MVEFFEAHASTDSEKVKQIAEPLRIPANTDLPENNRTPPAANVFVFKFLGTFSWWVLGFFAIALIGLIGAIF